MLPRNRLTAVTRAADDFEKTHSPQATVELAKLSRDALPAKTWRDVHRLLGFPESLTVGHNPGAELEGRRLQKINRKMTFTVAPLRVPGLGQKKQPTQPKKQPKKSRVALATRQHGLRISHRMRWIA